MPSFEQTESMLSEKNGTSTQHDMETGVNLLSTLSIFPVLRLYFFVGKNFLVTLYAIFSSEQMHLFLIGTSNALKKRFSKILGDLGRTSLDFKNTH